MAPAASSNAASSTVVAKKADRGKAGTPLKLKSNVFPLTLLKNTPFFKHDFRVKVSIKLPDGKVVIRELTDRSRYYEDETRKCANVYVLHALAKKAPFLQKSLIYDRAAILFTLKEIVKADEELSITLPHSALGPNEIFGNVQSVAVTVKKATDKYQITSDDYVSAAGADFVEGGDKCIFELLNIATSQCVVDHQSECNADDKSRIYILNPRKYSDVKELDIGGDQFLRTSIKKSVKTVEGPLGKDGKPGAPIAALIVDVSYTAMHKPDLVSNKLRKKVLHEQLIGAKTTKQYGNREQVQIAGFARDSVANCVVKIGETKMKLPAYLKKQHNITLKEPNMPAVLDRRGNAFAPETLMVHTQPVQPEQFTTDTSRAIILANAVPGDERMRAIGSLKDALHLHDESAKRAGVHMPCNTAALKVDGRMLPAKKLVFGGTTTTGFLRGDKPLFFPMPVAKWAYLVVSTRGDYRRFVEALLKKAPALGMSIAAAPTYGKNRLKLSQVFAELGKAHAAGCTYALVVSDVEGDHTPIKAAERHFGILTQEVRGRTTERAVGDTGTNVLLKMNVKNGGLNYVVGDEPLLLQMDVLIMSLVFDHPTSMLKKEMEEGIRPTRPAFVGISSNAAPLMRGGKILPESCQNFTENFAYANPQEWQKEGEPTLMDTVSALIKHEIEAFKTGRNNAAPQKLILYVSGVPEAERGYWSNEGKARIANACRTVNINPATTIITLSTEGCERFVPDSKPANQKGPDPRIGLVVDTVGVNPAVNEWFLQSAKALKGTPRTIKYTLVAEPAAAAKKMSMDGLQSLTWSLTHLHQFCFGTTSLPSPSRIAVDAAARAKALFDHQKIRGAYKLEDLNATLGFKSTKASATTRSV